MSPNPTRRRSRASRRRANAILNLIDLRAKRLTRLCRRWAAEHKPGCPCAWCEGNHPHELRELRQDLRYMAEAVDRAAATVACQLLSLGIDEVREYLGGAEAGVAHDTPALVEAPPAVVGAA